MAIFAGALGLAATQAPASDRAVPGYRGRLRRCAMQLTEAGQAWVCVADTLT